MLSAQSPIVIERVLMQQAEGRQAQGAGEAGHCDSQPQAAPTSNTGRLPASEAYSHWVMVDGKPKEILLKKGHGTAAFIDTLSFTVSEEVFIRPDQLGTDEELVASISAEMTEIMGYGLYCQKNGRNGYKYSYQMGNDTANYGFVAFGGARQRGTVFVYFTGQGLIAALSGWESRLYDWIKQRAPYAKITRVDLAHDFLEGEYTPDMAKNDWENGGYTSRHTRPDAQCVGSDWLDNKGKGKTFYVGQAASSRHVRVYEKGKEQGDTESPWVRVELQMRNKDIVIPHEVLIEAGKFLTGAYPKFQELFEKFNESIATCERIKKLKDIGHEHVLKYARMQVSPAIQMLKEFGLNNDEIVDALLNPMAKLPKRMAKEAYDCRHLNVRFLHEHKRLPMNVHEVIEAFGQQLEAENRAESRKPRLKHRSYEEYVALKESHELQQMYGTPDRSKSYDEWAYDRYAVPMWILNRQFDN